MQSISIMRTSEKVSTVISEMHEKERNVQTEPCTNRVITCTK